MATQGHALGTGSRQGTHLTFYPSFSPSPVCAEPSLAQKPPLQSGASARVVPGMNWPGGFYPRGRSTCGQGTPETNPGTLEGEATLIRPILQMRR